jgi:hypothetical protein
MEIKKLKASEFKVGQKYSVLGGTKELLEATFVELVPHQNYLRFLEKDGNKQKIGFSLDVLLKEGVNVVVHDDQDTFLVEMGSTIAGIAVIVGTFESREEAEQYRTDNLETTTRVAELNKEQADEECSVSVLSMRELNELLFDHFKQDTQLDAMYLKKTDSLESYLNMPIRSS